MSSSDQTLSLGYIKVSRHIESSLEGRSYRDTPVNVRAIDHVEWQDGLFGHSAVIHTLGGAQYFTRETVTEIEEKIFNVVSKHTQQDDTE